MCRWLAAASVLTGLLCVSGAGADDGRAFQKLKPEHWAYASVRRLESGRYFTGYQAGTFGGERVLTRYEFAVAVERMYRDLQPRVLAATEPGTLATDLETFRKLLAEFKEEIADLGQDMVEMERQLQAMEQRLARIQRATESAPGAPQPRDVFPGYRRGFPSGLQAGAERSLQRDPFDLLRDTSLRGPATALRPGVTAGFGPYWAGLQVNGPDPLHTVPGLPFADPADGLDLKAQLDVALGDFTVSAFFNRLGSNADPFGLWSPVASLGPVDGYGGAVSGSLSERLAFNLSTARLNPAQRDANDTLLVKGDVSWKLSNRLSLALGYMWSRSVGSFANTGISAYTLGIGRSFGANTRLDVLYRLFNSGNAGEPGAAGDGNSGAITQLTVKF